MGVWVFQMPYAPWLNGGGGGMTAVVVLVVVLVAKWYVDVCRVAARSPAVGLRLHGAPNQHTSFMC